MYQIFVDNGLQSPWKVKSTIELLKTPSLSHQQGAEVIISLQTPVTKTAEPCRNQYQFKCTLYLEYFHCLTLPLGSPFWHKTKARDYALFIATQCRIHFQTDSLPDWKKIKLWKWWKYGVHLRWYGFFRWFPFKVAIICFADVAAHTTRFQRKMSIKWFLPRLHSLEKWSKQQNMLFLNQVF